LQVTIGKHCVAAVDVVTKNIPPYSVAVGNPARVLKQYNPENNIGKE
jgi:acetyltransferase-like isoleucine patch superfamily enzyme